MLLSTRRTSRRRWSSFTTAHCSRSKTFCPFSQILWLLIILRYFEFGIYLVFFSWTLIDIRFRIFSPLCCCLLCCLVICGSRWLTELIRSFCRMPFALHFRNTVNTLNNWRRKWTKPQKVQRKFEVKFRDFATGQHTVLWLSWRCYCCCSMLSVALCPLVALFLPTGVHFVSVKCNCV